MICHCGRAARGFAWSDPVTRTKPVPACSMRCLNVVRLAKGNLLLFKTETDAIEKAIKPHLADIQAFFDGKPSAGDVLDYMAWAYETMCEAMAESYKQIVPDDIPY